MTNKLTILFWGVRPLVSLVRWKVRRLLVLGIKGIECHGLVLCVLVWDLGLEDVWGGCGKIACRLGLNLVSLKRLKSLSDYSTGTCMWWYFLRIVERSRTDYYRTIRVSAQAKSARRFGKRGFQCCNRFANLRLSTQIWNLRCQSALVHLHLHEMRM